MILDVKPETRVDLVLDRFPEVKVVLRVVTKFAFLLVTDLKVLVDDRLV